RRRHTIFSRDWSSDVCSSDLKPPVSFHRSAILFPIAGCEAAPVNILELPPAFYGVLPLLSCFPKAALLRFPTASFLLLPKSIGVVLRRVLPSSRVTFPY